MLWRQQRERVVHGRGNVVELFRLEVRAQSGKKIEASQATILLVLVGEL